MLLNLVISFIVISGIAVYYLHSDDCVKQSPSLSSPPRNIKLFMYSVRSSLSTLLLHGKLHEHLCVLGRESHEFCDNL